MIVHGCIVASVSMTVAGGYGDDRPTANMTCTQNEGTEDMSTFTTGVPCTNRMCNKEGEEWAGGEIEGYISAECKVVAAPLRLPCTFGLLGREGGGELLWTQQAAVQ